MPGVLRPYTLTDVIATLNGQSTAATPDTSINGIGVYAEDDDAVTVGDSWTSAVQANPTWDNGIWGQFTWG